MKNIIYLGESNNKFEYYTIEKLQEEAKKYNISIGSNTFIGNESVISYDTVIGENVNIGKSVNIWTRNIVYANVDIGDNSNLGDGSILGDYSSLGRNSNIGNNSVIMTESEIGDNVIIGENVTILDRAKIKAGWKITKVIHLINEYRYHVSGYVVNGKTIIQMGCYTRTPQEWENDFWNNDREFIEGTPEGEKRLKAFMKIKKIMELYND